MNTINSEVYERITRALLDDPRTKDAVIDVVNQQGVVTLTGVVESEKVRQAAEEIARDQAGVVTVMNELKIE